MQREYKAKAAEYMNSQPASQNGHSRSGGSFAASNFVPYIYNALLQIGLRYKFEKQLSWEAPHEFGIFNIISQVRDIPFAKGQVAYLEGQHQYAYLQNFGKMNVRGAKGGYIPKELAGVFRCFIRQRIHGPVPPPGAIITLQWNNSNPSKGKPHVPSKDPRDI